MKKIDDFAACIHTLLSLKTCSFRHLNKNISKQNFSNRDILYSNLCIKKMGVIELVKEKKACYFSELHGFHRKHIKFQRFTRSYSS